MERRLITINTEEYPDEFLSILKDAKIYDSSCSEAAKVIFIDKDDGYFLKRAAKGSLNIEAEMTRFFYKKRLAAEVLGYISGRYDYLLTRRVRGEDCTFYKYLEDPERLCDVLGEVLRGLHEEDFASCPVENRMEAYFETVRKNYENGVFDPSIFENKITIGEAWKIAEEGKKCLKSDTLIHGDYCLPNIMLENFKFSGFIDVGNGGVGDRHVDLFWGAWSLKYNLKTDKYRDRFFDAYGRDRIEVEAMRIIEAAECFG